MLFGSWVSHIPFAKEKLGLNDAQLGLALLWMSAGLLVMNPFAAIILKGNGGPFTIDGKPFNQIMPGQEAMLTDQKIAGIMTFVRANFGNTPAPVTPEVVAAARKKFADRTTPWTQPELDAWKDDAPAK